MDETKEVTTPPLTTEEEKQEMEEEINEENSSESMTLQSSENVDGNTIEQENDEPEEEQDPSKVEEIPESKDPEEEEPAPTKKSQGTAFRSPVKFSTKKPYPILKGHYVNDGNMCVWSGLWGMGMNGEVHGVTSDFRYQMKLTDAAGEGPQNGNYNGYFWMKVVPPKRITDNGLSLKFTKQDGIYLVEGRGQNKLGPFSLNGTYNPVTSTMVCDKTYLPLETGKKPKTKTKPKPKPRSRPVDEHLYSQSSHSRIPPVAPQTTYLRHSSLTPRGLSREMNLCYKCLRHIMRHKWSGPFLQPVDPIALNIPDYPEVVKEPMDLSTIQRRIETQMITTKEEFAVLMRLVFSNACLYNRPESDVGIMARTLSEEFEKELLQITGRLFAAGPEPSHPPYVQTTRRRGAPIDEPANKEVRVVAPKTHPMTQRARRLQEMQEMEAMIQSLQGTITRMEREINARKNGEKDEIDARPMTVEEKKALSVQVSQLNEADVAGLLAIVRESIPEDQNHQEAIELDFNLLPNEILRQMERYIRECKAAKTSSRKHRKTYTHTQESLFDYDDNHFVEDFNNSDSGQETY